MMIIFIILSMCLAGSISYGYIWIFTTILYSSGESTHTHQLSINTSDLINFIMIALWPSFVQQWIPFRFLSINCVKVIDTAITERFYHSNFNEFQIHSLTIIMHHLMINFTPCINWIRSDQIRLFYIALHMSHMHASVRVRSCDGVNALAQLPCADKLNDSTLDFNRDIPGESPILTFNWFNQGETVQFIISHISIYILQK